MVYPKPYSICLRGTIGLRELLQDETGSIYDTKGYYSGQFEATSPDPTLNDSLYLGNGTKMALNGN